MSGALSPRLYADLVGKPFRAAARGPDAFDCLGLCMEIARRRRFPVPEYASTAEELAQQISDDGGVLGVCRQIPGPEAGAVVLLRSDHDAARHMGVMLDRYRMIHASEPSGQVVIETLTRSAWRFRVLGYYELEAPDPAQKLHNAACVAPVRHSGEPT